MRKVLIVLSISSLLMLSGCGAVGNTPVLGTLYTNVKAPITATNNPKGSKTGEAKCMSILGLVAVGDCSVEAAAKEGKINKVSTVDYKNISVLGLYTEVKVIVTGE